MIDWTKPIETVLGRKATIRHERKVGPTAKVFIVEIDPPAGGVLGFVYMLDELGRRCDDNAPIDSPVFIRNVKVKKEGWVLMVLPTKTSFVTFSGPMYETREKALEALEEVLMKMDYHSTLSFKQPGIKPVYLKWEE